MKRLALALVMLLAVARMAGAACTTTINLGLQICDFGDPSWEVFTNANFNKLDLSFASPLSRSGVAVTLGTVPYSKGGTGITTYAKGDLLAGVTSGALAVLPVGTDGYALVADSTQTTGYKFASVASPPYSDALAFLLDDTDGTKKLRFELGGFTPGAMRVLIPQNRDGTIADLALNVFLDHQTLDNQKALRLREATANGTNYTGFRAPASLAANLIYDLPTVDGSAGDVFSTNADGTTQWVPPSSGSGDITDVWGCTTGNCNAITAASGDSLNASAADTTKPCKTGTSPPGTCGASECFIDTDATPSAQFLVCTATNTWTAQGGGGGGGFTNSARVTNSAAQTITNAGAASLTFDTEDFDNGGMHSTVSNTSRITIPTSGNGIYIFTCSVAFVGDTTGLRYVALMLNGTTFEAVQGIPLTGDTATMYLSVSTLMSLVATDYMECKVNQGTAGNLDTVAASDYTPIFTAAQIQ